MSICSFRSFVKNVGVLLAIGGVFNSGVINSGGDIVLFTGEERRGEERRGEERRGEERRGGGGDE